MPGWIAKAIGTTVVLAAVALGSFLAVRAVVNDGGAGAQTAPVGAGKNPIDAIEEERQKPRFEGELIGFYLAPSEDKIPQSLRSSLPTCKIVRVLLQDTGPLNLQFDLPSGYVYDPEAEDSAHLGCADGGPAYAAKWLYTTSFNKYQGSLLVTRTRLTFDVFRVAADRVKVVQFAGRQAILIEPIIPETGYGGFSEVIFPSTTGITTRLHSNNVPRAEFLAVAEIIGKAVTAAER